MEEVPVPGREELKEGGKVDVWTKAWRWQAESASHPDRIQMWYTLVTSLSMPCLMSWHVALSWITSLVHSSHHVPSCCQSLWFLTLLVDSHSSLALASPWDSSTWDSVIFLLLLSSSWSSWFPVATVLAVPFTQSCLTMLEKFDQAPLFHSSLSLGIVSVTWKPIFESYEPCCPWELFFIYIKIYMFM